MTSIPVSLLRLDDAGVPGGFKHPVLAHNWNTEPLKPQILDFFQTFEENTNYIFLVLGLSLSEGGFQFQETWKRRRLQKEIHGVRTMDTFRIIKSLANHLLSLSILLLWQDRQTIWSVYSLSVLVYIWLAAEMITERLTNSETELVPFHFPFISHHFYPTRTVIEHCDWSVEGQ